MRRPIIIITNLSGFGHLVPAITLHEGLKKQGANSKIFFLESLLQDWKWKELFNSYETLSKQHWKIARIISYANRYSIQFLGLTSISAYNLSSIVDFTRGQTPLVVSFVGWGAQVAQKLASVFDAVVPVYAVHTNWHFCDQWKGIVNGARTPIFHLGCFEDGGVAKIGIPTSPLHGSAGEDNLIVLSGGGWGLGDIRKVARELNQGGYPSRIILGNGSSAQASSTSETLYCPATSEEIISHIHVAQGAPEPLYPALVKWGDCCTPKFMRTHPAEIALDRASHFIGKPGGVSTYEALKKGIRVSLLPPTNVTEARNREVLIGLGFAKDYVGNDDLAHPCDIDDKTSSQFVRDESAAILEYIRGTAT